MYFNSKEMKLLPCSACSDPKDRMQGGKAVFLVQLDRSWDCGGWWYRVICADCGKRGRAGCCGEKSATYWNNAIYEDALPRALTWTTEPPKVPGFYFQEYMYGENKEYKSLHVIEVLPIDHWKYPNKQWEERNSIKFN